MISRQFPKGASSGNRFIVTVFLEASLEIILFLNFRVFQTISYDETVKIKVVDL
jgi:hypothetical protein